MIYKKDANFPYPILKNESTSYQDSQFILDVSLEENTDDYRFKFEYEISSPFIKDLLNKGKAILIFIIQSRDNKFFPLNPNQKAVEISKKRISLTKRTSIQLHIQSTEEICFDQNEDLSPFYYDQRGKIVVPKNSLLGFSNIVTYEGSVQDPYQLFEKKLDETLPSEIKYELGSDTIIIHYSNRDFQFSDIRKGQFLNNPYIYTGLRAALQQFITEYGEEGYVDLTQINPPENHLYYKLYNLMTNKMVEEISFDSIDEVVSLISNRMIDKYVGAIKELSNGD